MKYRIVELLRCPEHVHAMLRVTDANLSEVFPFSGELSIPLCRSGCGLLGNWLADVPDSLPRIHRLDCRRCLGTEIESGFLECPECGWCLAVVDGVIQACGELECSFAAEPTLSSRAGKPIQRHLDLHRQELALILAPLPGSVIQKWSREGVERLQVELSAEVMLSGRARCCANGEGMVHYLGGPLEISILRPGEFDAIVAMVPTERIMDSPGWMAGIPELLRPSGRAVLIYPRDLHSPRASADRLKSIRNELPETFSDLILRIAPIPGADLILAGFPEPENGFGIKALSRNKS